MPARALTSLLALVASALMAAAGDKACADPHARAGRPQEVSKFAVPASRARYAGGYVGGSCLFRKGDGGGEPAGAWGWDYVGLGRRPGRVFLGWCGDRKGQEPAGKYATDGPRVKDVIVPIPKHPGEGH